MDPQECTQDKCIYAANYADCEINGNQFKWEGSDSEFLSIHIFS